MFNAELERLEGVWIGKERVSDGGTEFDAAGRLVFQIVFDGRFLLCDYVQTAPERQTAFAHGVFRRDDRTDALTVSWFRIGAAASGQQVEAIAAGDQLMFFETVAGRTTRTSYVVAMDRLSVFTERATGDDDWKRIFEGTYRRR